MLFRCLPRLGAVLALVAGCHFGSGPAIEFPAIIELGERDQGEIISHQLVLANRGRSPLRIWDVRTNCSCSGLERDVNGSIERVTDLVVPPGQTVPVRFRLAVRGLPGKELRTALLFACNDPRQPEGMIDIVVSRIRGIATTPTAAVFGSVPVGAVAKTTVELRDLSGDAVVVKSIECSNTDLFSGRLLEHRESPVPPRPNVAWVEVTANTAAPATIDGYIQVQVETSAGAKFVTIPVRANVTAPVEVTPRIVFLPRRSSEGPIYHARCLCRASSGQPLRLFDNTTPPGVHVSIEDASPDSPVRTVIVQWNPAQHRSATGRQRVQLTAETGGQKHPVEIVLDLKATEGS